MESDRDGRLRPSNPIAHALSGHAVGRVRSLAIASGKGGVGKTWFAVSLATALAQNGRRILLVDGDLGLANVDVQLGLLPDRDLGGLIDSNLPLSEVVTPCDVGGFDVLAGRAGSGALSSLSATALEQVLLVLSGALQYDIILFDLGAGIDRHVRRMACWVDTLLVVATDEPTSLTDAYVVLKVHAADKQRLGAAAQSPARTDVRVVVNQAANHLSGMQTYDTLARVCSNYLGFVPDLGGVIRRDDRVRDAIRGQIPFPIRYPVSPAASDVAKIAVSFAGPTIPLAQTVPAQRQNGTA